jgi:ankyrin repeat protein
MLTYAHYSARYYAAMLSHTRYDLLSISKLYIVKNFQSPLHAAAARNRSDYCELLVEKGSSLGMQDVDGMTPLHEAAFRGNFETFEVLRRLASNDDFNILDAMGNSASAYLSRGSEKEWELVATTRAEGKDDNGVYSSSHTSNGRGSSAKEGDDSDAIAPSSGRK